MKTHLLLFCLLVGNTPFGAGAQPLEQRFALKAGEGAAIDSTSHETITVHAHASRYAPAPMPGHRRPDGLSATALYDPRSGASVGEFGYAYLLAAP